MYVNRCTIYIVVKTYNRNQPLGIKSGNSVNVRFCGLYISISYYIHIYLALKSAFIYTYIIVKKM